MKKTNIILTILSLIFLLSLFGNSLVFADNSMETVEMSETKKKTLLYNMNIKRIEKAPPKTTISYFDVNSKGMFAVGYERVAYRGIAVFDKDGNFLFGYKFNSSGSFCFELNDNNLVIYVTRSDAAIDLSFDGEIIGVAELKDTKENREYKNNHILARKKSENDVTYIMKSGGSILHYGKITATSPDGEEKTIYSSGAIAYIETGLIITGLVVFITLLTISMVRLKKNYKDYEYKQYWKRYNRL